MLLLGRSRRAEEQLQVGNINVNKGVRYKLTVWLQQLEEILLIFAEQVQSQNSIDDNVKRKRHIEQSSVNQEQLLFEGCMVDLDKRPLIGGPPNCNAHQDCLGSR